MTLFGLGLVANALLCGCRVPPVIPNSADRLTSPRLSARIPSGWDRVRQAPAAGPPKAEFAAPSTSGQRQPSEPTSVQLVSATQTLESTPATELSLEAAVRMALEHNPDLAGIRTGESVAHAAYHVAETKIYNPQFQTQILPYSRDSTGNDGAVSQQHVIVQTFERGGQQRYRKGVASAGWQQIRGTIEQAELANIAQTARLYWTAVYQRELMMNSSLMADLNEQLVGVIERREEAGQSNSADVELARVQAKMSRRQQRLADANYQTALTLLRNHMNLESTTPLALPRGWTQWQWRPIEDVLGEVDSGAITTAITTPPHEAQSNAPRLERDGSSAGDAAIRKLIAARPDVRAARWGVAMAEANLRLANAMRRPSIQAGPMYQRDGSSTTFWGIQAQFDLPVVNTGTPLVLQRQAELQQQQKVAEQLEVRALLEARAAMRRYELARHLVDQSRASFNSDLTRSLQPFEDQFQAGQITLLQVFAARGTIAQSQQSFHDLLNELAQAAAEVTQATGLSPMRILNVQESEAVQLLEPSEEEIPLQ